MTTVADPMEALHVPGAGKVFALAWPMTLKAIFLHGTVVIDGWLVSSLGEASLAAMGLAAAMGGIVLGVIFAFSHAMQIRTAQAFGNGDRVLLKSVLASGLTVSLSIGVIGVLAILIFGNALALALAPEILLVSVFRSRPRVASLWRWIFRRWGCPPRGRGRGWACLR